MFLTWDQMCIPHLLTSNSSRRSTRLGRPPLGSWPMNLLYHRRSQLEGEGLGSVPVHDFCCPEGLLIREAGEERAVWQR
jgi:hypothetical protein